MLERSPSPLITTTFRSGFASFKPVAKGMARPCVVWNEFELHVARNAARAADARHHRDLVAVEAARLDRLGEGGDDGADAAARAPDMRQPVHAKELRHGVFLAEGRFVRWIFWKLLCTAHFAPSLMAARISSGSCTAPPQELTLITLHWPAAQRSTSRTICP